MVRAVLEWLLASMKGDCCPCDFRIHPYFSECNNVHQVLLKWASLYMRLFIGWNHVVKIIRQNATAGNYLFPLDCFGPLGIAAIKQVLPVPQQKPLCIVLLMMWLSPYRIDKCTRLVLQHLFHVLLDWPGHLAGVLPASLLQGEEAHWVKQCASWRTVHLVASSGHHP